MMFGFERAVLLPFPPHASWCPFAGGDSGNRRTVIIRGDRGRGSDGG